MPDSVKKTIVISACCAIFMFCFSFALVPLYRVVCKVTGLNGGVNVAEVKNDTSNTPQRAVTIQFVTTNNQNLAWDFYPKQNTLKVLSDKKAEMIFYVKNNTHHIMTVQAIPSFAPQIAARYFHKIECFCFRQQTLWPGEWKTLPVIFRVDLKLPKEIQVITLSYTLFEIHDKRKSG